MRAALLLGCGAFALGLNLAAERQARGEALCKVAFLGDSLTAGYGLPESESWPAQMQARLQADGIDCLVINAGLSGDTTAGGRARLGWVLADAPSHLVLALGANDGLRGLPVAEMAANLDAMLAELRTRRVHVLLAGMLAPPNYGADYAADYEAAFASLAAEYEVAFYRFLLDGVAAQPHLNQADGIHPNRDGVAEMVRRIWPEFRAWLTQNPPAG